jgi:hypothetical protein
MHRSGQKGCRERRLQRGSGGVSSFLRFEWRQALQEEVKGATRARRRTNTQNRQGVSRADEAHKAKVDGESRAVSSR